MRSLFVLAVVGYGPVGDGSLWMAYGVTSTTLLLTVGSCRRSHRRACISRRWETTWCRGVSHWRSGLVEDLVDGDPGGVWVLSARSRWSYVAAELAAPFVAVFLFSSGLHPGSLRSGV